MSETHPDTPRHTQTHPDTPRHTQFNELAEHAEAGFVKRAVARYLIPHDTAASIKRHERLGTPLVRKVVMGTVGRITPAYSGTNYRLNLRPGRMEAATNFAVKATAFNEAVHTVAAGLNVNSIAHDWAANGAEFHYSMPILAGNLALVALQRYNRARTVGFVDRRLQHGGEFSEDYKNWLGIDARADENFEAQTIQTENTLSQSPDLRLVPPAESQPLHRL